MEAVFPYRKMEQICIVTNDVKKTNRYWAEFTGQTYVTPNMYYDAEHPENNAEVIYMGKPTQLAGYESNTFDLSCNGLSIQFEILQAHGASSEWRRFMDERGCGFHHIAFVADDFEECLLQAEKLCDSKVIHRGRPFGSPTSSYAYFDTKESMGTTIEVLNFGKDSAAAADYRRACAIYSSVMLSAKPVLDKVFPCAVTLVVQDMEQSRGQFAKLLGVVPPSVISVSNGTTVSGDQPTTDAAWKKTVWDLKTMSLEMIQPVTGSTAWGKFAEQWKDGLAVISFEVKDLDDGKERLEKFGLPIVQSGIMEDGVTRYAIFDGMDTMGVCIEIRTSERIREKLEKEAANAPSPIDMSRKYNETTRISEIAENEEARNVFEKYLPGFFAQPQMRIGIRLPLGIALRLSSSQKKHGIREETIRKILDDLNAVE